MAFLKRLDKFNALALIVLIGLVLFLARSGCGAGLGVALGQGGTVLGVRASVQNDGVQGESVQPGDRIISIDGQPVGSLAEIGNKLRNLTPRMIPEPLAEGSTEVRMVPATVSVALERPDYRFVEQLGHHLVKERGWPSSIQDTDVVVRIGNNDIPDTTTKEFVLSELERQPDEIIPVVFQRRVHQFYVNLPLTEPPMRPWPSMIFALALAMVFLIGWRARSSPDDKGQSIWWPMALSSAALPWAAVLLADPVETFKDPILLMLGFVGLIFFRPWSLIVHRRLHNGAKGALRTGLWMLPAFVAIALAIMDVFVPLAPVLWGGAINADLEYGAVQLLQIAVALVAIYHIIDGLMWFRQRLRNRVLPLEVRQAHRWPQLGVMVSTLALVTAVLHAVKDPFNFLSTAAYTYHASALILILWLGDMGLAISPTHLGQGVGALPEVIIPELARDDLKGFIDEIGRMIRPDAPSLVVVRGKTGWRIWINDILEEPELELEPAHETLISGVGLFRDENIALPIHRHEDEDPTDGEQVVEGAASSLGVTTAFKVFDEADQREGLDHEARERVFFAFCIVEGGTVDLQKHEMAAVRDRFKVLWPQVRHLIIERILSDAAAYRDRPAPAPTPEPAPVAAPQPEATPEVVPEAEPKAEPKPEPEIIREVEVREVVKEISIVPAEMPFLRRDLAEAYPLDEMELLEPELERRLEGLAAEDSPVIIAGPAGIGKEFAARRLHAAGEARSGPFIKFNVSTCPPSLRTLELLGEMPGEGHLGAARGGVLYVEDVAELDEISFARLLAEAGDLEPPVRLILSVRTLYDQPSKDSIKTLEGSLGRMAQGMFSHRIVTLAPLIERPKFVKGVADHYLLVWSMKHNKVITDISPKALETLTRRRWPGGVSELRIALEAAVLRCDGDKLEAHHLALPSTSTPADDEPRGDAASVEMWLKMAPDLREALWRLQQLVYLEALEREQGNKSAAARLVGVKRTTFVRHLKQRDADD